MHAQGVTHDQASARPGSRLRDAVLWSAGAGRSWNPKMKRFIFGERNGIYIIDLEKTVVGIEQAYAFVRDTVAFGGSILFVGTKKQAQEPIEQEAKRVGMPYVNQRWLGGMLTNFQTISKRLARLRELEAMESTGTFDVLPQKEVLKLPT